MAGDPFGLSGQVIEAQFRVDHPVGEGGFSLVYKGLHLGLDEWVAIKCLKLQSNLETQMIESFAMRFKDESRIAYRLSQGSLDIVRSITAGTTVAPATGALLPYMVLEWLDGKSLAVDLRERRQHGMTGRTIDEVIELFDPAAMAIAYAHEQGVVHRDIKPGNLFIARTRTGQTRLKVLDFGLAKIVGESALGIVPSVRTVGQHTIVCSPSYGAPEQFDPAVGAIGPWTDVYGLGIVLLEALRDQKVRSGDGLAQCAVQALDAAQAPTCHSLGIKVRPQVEVALARACALDTKTRHANVGELWEQLKRAAVRSPASVRAPARAKSEPPPADLATVWDPRGAAMRDTPTPAVNVNKQEADPFNATALMLDAPARPASARPPTMPMAMAPTVPPGSRAPAVPLARTAPMSNPHPNAPAHSPPQYPQMPQAQAPAYAPPPQPAAHPHAHVNAPAHAQAYGAPPAHAHAYSAPSPSAMPPPVIPRSRAPIVVLAIIVVLALLTGIALTAYRFLLAR